MLFNNKIWVRIRCVNPIDILFTSYSGEKRCVWFCSEIVSTNLGEDIELEEGIKNGLDDHLKSEDEMLSREKNFRNLSSY